MDREEIFIVCKLGLKPPPSGGPFQHLDGKNKMEIGTTENKTGVESRNEQLPKGFSHCI